MAFVRPQLVISLCVFLPLNAAYADKLPETATKLSPAEVKMLYAGKSSNWDSSKAYFAPDGTYLMVAKDKSWYGEGRWTVSGNKACASITWHTVKDGKSGKGKPDCWTWNKDGKKYWVLWSGDKGKKGYPADYWWDGELKKMKKGDSVTAAYNKLKSKK